MSAIRKRLGTFVAIIGLVLAAAAVGTYIVSHQRLKLPGWVPFVGQKFFVLKAEMQTAQAVTPGQGQVVEIAGVPVGEIAGVQLEDGRGIVSMNIKPKYAAIYRNATILLRPKTGLKDMIAELDPGDPTTGKLSSGQTIPIDSTLPDVNPDEVLAALDGDTRDYLKLLLNGAGGALSGQGPALSAALRRLDPTARDLNKITHLLALRRANVRRVIHNFSQLSIAVGEKDNQLASLVGSSNAVFAAFANQDAALQQTIALLPGALQQTQVTLGKVNAFAGELGPTLNSLEPTARNLAPALSASRPFFRTTTPVIANELRPFTRVSLPVVRQLNPPARDLAALMPNLFTSLGVANQLVNELAFEPGGNQQGFLFWLSWANHDGDLVFNTQDALGPVRRGLFALSCSSLGLLQQVEKVNPQLQLLVGLLQPPTVCPSSSGPP